MQNSSNTNFVSIVKSISDIKIMTIAVTFYLLPKQQISVRRLPRRYQTPESRMEVVAEELRDDRDN